MTTEKARTRKGKAQPKGIQDVERNLDGLAVEPVAYEWGKAERGTDLCGFYRYSDKEKMFLDEYAKDADHKRAASVVGMTTKQMENMLLKPSIKAEILEIQEVWRLNRKMTAERAAAKHIKIMNKLEKDYDELDLSERSKMASPLVKASETYLKASGHFNHGDAASESQVIINIDLGGDPENEKKVSISGEKKDGG